jgi:hypothetical protein
MSDDPLDQINRAVIAIAALLIAFVTLIVVVLAWAELGSVANQFEDFAGWLRDHDTNDAKLIISLGALVVILLMAGIMIIELTPSPTQKMRLRDVKAGDATVTTHEIAARIEDDLKQLRHIAAAQAIVAARGSKVEVVLDLQVDPGANLATTADEACRRAHTLVEQTIGVELAGLPRARLHYRELQLRAPLTPAAAGGLAPAPPPQPSTGWERPPEGANDGDN